MRLLFVADGRSPIALNWIKYWVDGGHEVHLVSTFACQPHLQLASLEVVTVAYSGAKPRPAALPSTRAEARSARGLVEGSRPESLEGRRPVPVEGRRSELVEGRQPSSGSGRGSFIWGAGALNLRTRVRQWVGPLTVARSSRRLLGVIQRIRPDLVHAMRVPFEGMLSADAIAAIPDAPPLLISIWGNDFTLHALSSPPMRHYTEWTMQVADALHTDCQRDLRLAKQWGFKPGLPGLVTPGNGGIRAEVFFPPPEPAAGPMVVNPRGFRGYVCNQAFFRAIPLVLKERPDARFVCADMAGEPQALAWVRALGIRGSVELLPLLAHEAMADLLRSAQVLVSPTTHDGTPNSLLEGMACGCFPVAGDLESVREWITPGVNGLLVDPTDPQALAEAILRGLNEATLRLEAAAHNAAIISARAEYGQNMARAEAFYQRLVAR